MSEDRYEAEDPTSAYAGQDTRREAGGDVDDERRTEQRGAESCGGDPDSEPSVSEEEVEAGMNRDQAEG